MSPGRRGGALAAGLATLAVGCGGPADSGANSKLSSPGVAATVSGSSTGACLVRLHGKSETGASPQAANGYVELAPTGNEPDGDGHMWIYFPEDSYAEARQSVVEAIDEASCEQTVLNGFSNGAAFAATLYCRGETFGNRVVGVVVDDPVPDEGVVDCSAADGVEVALYWTGALEDVEAGTDCGSVGWICAGGRVLGIDDYADALGTPILASPYDEHIWYRDAPELVSWLGLQP